MVYSQCLTRDGSDIACYKLDPMRILASPTEAQDVLRIMDDRPYARNAATRSRHGLGKTRFGGFFCGRRKSRGGRKRVPAATFLLTIEFRRCALGDFRPQLQ